MKLSIVGTRDPGLPYSVWEAILVSKVAVEDVTLIISGGAKGIDGYAKLFADKHHIPLMEFLPDYSKYGRKATLIRNIQIVRESSMVVAFPSSESRGTYHTINEANRLGKPLFIINIPTKAA